MWNIMVADDEPKIRRGLCRFIEGSGLPLQVCAQAGDGAEALSALRESRPDIVLLDICMPRRSGLDFLAEAKARGLKSKFIVVTGFDEFSYAQASVSLRAFAYLLKPINEQELTEHLQLAIQELESELLQKQKNKQAFVQIEHNESLLKRAFEQKWMHGRLDMERWEEEASFWGLAWPETAYMTLLKPDFQTGRPLPVKEQALMLFGASNIASEMLAPLLVRFCGRDERGFCVIITERPPERPRLDEIIAAIRLHLNLPCFMDSTLLDKPADMPEGIAALTNRLEALERANPILEEIKEFIGRNYKNSGLSLVDIAAALHISPPYISRLMKTALQTTFVDYLTSKRIKEAIRLMKEPENKLSWISQQVGYSNQHYFSSVFKKYTGVSPSVYRENQEGGL